MGSQCGKRSDHQPCFSPQATGPDKHQNKYRKSCQRPQKLYKEIPDQLNQKLALKDL
jgi:hypothetical protein